MVRIVGIEIEPFWCLLGSYGISQLGGEMKKVSGKFKLGRFGLTKLDVNKG